MVFFFLTLMTLTLSLLGLSLYAFYTLTPLWHFSFALLATVSCLFTHSWVFFYFIGTGQGIREGVLAHKLDASAIKLTKKFKGKTFPFALFSMIFAIVATVTGVGVRFESVLPITRAIWIFIALSFNLFSFWQEYRVIQTNEQLMKKLNAQIEV